MFSKLPLNFALHFIVVAQFAQYLEHRKCRHLCQNSNLIPKPNVWLLTLDLLSETTRVFWMKPSHQATQNCTLVLRIQNTDPGQWSIPIHRLLLSAKARTPSTIFIPKLGVVTRRKQQSPSFRIEIHICVNAFRAGAISDFCAQHCTYLFSGALIGPMCDGEQSSDRLVPKAPPCKALRLVVDSTCFFYPLSCGFGFWKR